MKREQHFKQPFEAVVAQHGASDDDDDQAPDTASDPVLDKAIEILKAGVEVKKAA